MAVGRALMARPSLIMLDEPSAGLSPKMTDMVFQKLLEIRAGGVTILLVEQNAKAALAICDRGYVLAEGRDRFTGTACGAALQSRSGRTLSGLQIEAGVMMQVSGRRHRSRLLHHARRRRPEHGFQHPQLPLLRPGRPDHQRRLHRAGDRNAVWLRPAGCRAERRLAHHHRAAVRGGAELAAGDLHRPRHLSAAAPSRRLAHQHDHGLVRRVAHAAQRHRDVCGPGPAFLHLRHSAGAADLGHPHTPSTN